MFDEHIGRLIFFDTGVAHSPQPAAHAMHTCVAMAVKIMMEEGRNFVLLLWLGQRDWETSSAFTRGKVSGTR